MIDRISPPETFDIEHFMLNKPLLKKLNNEISFYHFFNSTLDLIHFHIQIKGGSLFETKKMVSSTYFNLLKESHPSMSASEIDDILDFYGASWNVSTNLEYSTIQWIIPKSNTQVLIPILIDLLINPVFKIENLELYKHRKIKDLEYNELKYNYRATQLMFHTFFKENSPTATILKKEHILDLSISDLHHFHNQFMKASNISLFVAGNMDEEFENLIKSSFEKIEKGNSIPLISELKDQFTPSLVLDEQKEPMQSSLILCKKSISYLEEDRRSFSILSTILGGYFGSRLMQNLREKNGFTYGVHCGSMYLSQNSIFYIESDVTADKTKDAIEQCFIEMDRLKTDEVLDTELKTVQRYLQGMLLRDIDGVVSFMKKYSFWNHFGLDEKEIETTLNAINPVNNDLLIKNAKKHLQNEDFYTIIVGKL